MTTSDPRLRKAVSTLNRSSIAPLRMAVLLSGCASTLNVLDQVKTGQSEAQAMESVCGSPLWAIGDETTRFLGHGSIAAFADMYERMVTYYL